MTKGILTATNQAIAQQMLHEIGDKQKATDKKEPFIMTMERRDLRDLWTGAGMGIYCSFDGEERKEYEEPQPPRNFTDMEFDLIKQVHGRIKKE